MTKLANICTISFVLAIAGSVAMAVPSDTVFSGAVSNDWNDVNNWLQADGSTPFGQLPGTDDMSGIGAYYTPDVTAVIHSGESYSIRSLEIANYGSGTLNVEAGGTLDVSPGSFWVGYAGGDYDPSITAELTVDGTINYEGWNCSIGGNTAATVNIGASGAVYLTNAPGNTIALNIGQDYHEDYGFDTIVNQAGGILSVQGTEGGIVQVRGHDGYTATYKMSGGTIDTNVRWFNLDNSIFEVAGQATANASMRFYGGGDANAPGPATLKFSGSDPLLTVNSINFGTAALAVIDISELTVTPGQWTTVLTAGGMGNSTNYELATGGDANWTVLVNDADDGLIQVLYGEEVSSVIPGDANLDGYVDDDDLSLLLSSWGQVADWANGEFSGIDPVNDDDLSILLTNWHVGTPAAAGELIPEPATMVLLGLGAVALIRKRLPAYRR